MYIDQTFALILAVEANERASWIMNKFLRYRKFKVISLYRYCSNSSSKNVYNNRTKMRRTQAEKRDLGFPRILVKSETSSWNIRKKYLLVLEFQLIAMLENSPILTIQDAPRGNRQPVSMQMLAKLPKAWGISHEVNRKGSQPLIQLFLVSHGN